MTDTTTTDTTTATETTDATASTDTGTPSIEQLQAEVEKWKTTSRKHEDRAKANATAAKELEDLRTQSMSDIERAVADAKNAGRAEALLETGGRLVAAEIKAAAAGRLTAEQLAEMTDNLNLAKFLTEDGDVDEAKVTKFVDGIAPKTDDEETGGTPFPDLGQGARGGSTTALNGDPLLRAVKQKLGAR